MHSETKKWIGRKVTWRTPLDELKHGKVAKVKLDFSMTVCGDVTMLTVVANDGGHCELKPYQVVFGHHYV